MIEALDQHETDTAPSFQTTRKETYDPGELRARQAKLQKLYAKLLESHALYTQQHDNGNLEIALKNGGHLVDTGNTVRVNWRGNDTKSTIDAMVLMARAKGWRSVEMQGDDQFRREAWLELAKVGIAVRNYQPTLQMQDELRAYQIERYNRSQEEALRRQAEHQPAAAEPQYRAPMPGM